MSTNGTRNECTYYIIYVIKSSVPTGFGGEPSTFGEFVAVQSGPFNAQSTWSEGIVPYGKCSIVISPNVEVTLPKPVLDLNMAKCDIHGSLILGSAGSESFTFLYPSNIIVHRNGAIQEKTAASRLISPNGTILTIYPNGSFIGNNTDITTLTASKSETRATNRLTIGSNFRGPYTCGILPGNKIQNFNKVTSMVASSGSFDAPGTWLGGIAPTSSVCDLVGGCGMSISSSYTLSTTDLNGVLKTNFDEITVAAGASFQLGAPGLDIGFKFTFKLTLNCYGTLQDVTGGTGGIFLPMGSSMNLFSGSRFISEVPTFLHVYDSATGTTVGTALTLSVSFVGPYFISVSTTGQISVSTTSK